MKIMHLIKNYHVNGQKRYKSFACFIAELMNIYKRRDEWKSCKLTKEQESAAKKFMKDNYGKTLPLWWHRLYTNYTGVFDEKYFPEILFSVKLEEILNPHATAFPLGNKAFNPQRLFAGIAPELNVKVPKAYLLDCNGIKWDEDGNVVRCSEIANLLKNAGEVIIKPTLDSTGAKGVRLLNIHGTVDILTGEEVIDIINNYKADFIVQERVRNHESFAKLYPNSINTLRVVTFICNEEIHVAPLSMRIGVGGRYVDNAGIFIGVNRDGSLRDTGFTKTGINRFKEHPDTNVKFEGYKLEGVSDIVNAAVRLHGALPQLQILSWDLGYDENGKVVIIEVNTHSHSLWFPQMVTGESFFGEFTADMYKLLIKK